MSHQVKNYLSLIENRIRKLDEFVKSMLNFAKANRGIFDSKEGKGTNIEIRIPNLSDRSARPHTLPF